MKMVVVLVMMVDDDCENSGDKGEDAGDKDIGVVFVAATVVGDGDIDGGDNGKVRR